MKGKAGKGSKWQRNLREEQVASQNCLSSLTTATPHVAVTIVLRAMSVGPNRKKNCVGIWLSGILKHACMLCL